MTGSFVFGQYQPSDSPGHRLDPRGKLIYAIFLMIISLFTSSAQFYSLIVLLILAMLLLSNISLASVYRNLKPFIILVTITALYHLIFSARETETVVEYYGMRLTEGGVRMALSYSLRVLVFVGIAFFISLTTSPADLAEVLVGWMKPIGKFGLPVNDIGLIIFIAMRFIPVLAEEFDAIRKAQINRGVDFTGGLIKRSRKMIALLIPVFHSAIRRADDLALAIESRGYISGGKRSSYHRFVWRMGDWLFLIFTISITTLMFVITESL